MTTILPRLALSIRQPWAWAIIFAGKDIENRSWCHPNPALNFRGEFAVHAAKGMTRDEYEDARDFMERFGVFVPAPHELKRGGIIGVASVTDIVSQSASNWFMGPRGLQLADAQYLPFVPAVGQLGFFEWKQADPSIMPAPAKWMLPDQTSGTVPAMAQANGQRGLF